MKNIQMTIEGFKDSNLLVREIEIYLKEVEFKDEEYTFSIEHLKNLCVVKIFDETSIIDTKIYRLHTKNNKFQIRFEEKENKEKYFKSFENLKQIKKVEEKNKKNIVDVKTLKKLEVINKIKENDDYFVSLDKEIFRYNNKTNVYRQITNNAFSGIIDGYINDTTIDTKILEDVEKRIKREFNKEILIKDNEFWNYNVNRKEEIVFDNCIYNYKNDTTRDIKKDDYIFNTLKSSYVKTKNNPKMFLKFLKDTEISENDISLLQEYFGYSLTSSSVYKNYLVLKGVTNSGKSVLINIIEDIIGSNYVSSLRPQDMDDQKKAYMIKGKILNIVPELGKDEVIGDGIKKFTSGGRGDTIAIERKYHDSELIKPYSKTIITTNHDLKFEDDNSGSMSSRLLLVEFNKSVNKKDLNENLVDDILENEKDEIVNWMLQGLKRLIKNKNFTISESKERFLNIKEEDDNYVLKFLRDENINNIEIELDELLEKYEEWAESEDLIYIEMKGSVMRKKLLEIKGNEIKRTTKKGFKNKVYIVTLNFKNIIENKDIKIIEDLLLKEKIQKQVDLDFDLEIEEEIKIIKETEEVKINLEDTFF